MTLPPDRLSAALSDRYRIERELGAGGMATVYLARDLKHDRDVAIKVLKPELAAVLGAERFVVEIKTTAALQHPNILPLFDSGTADGFLYYVMPFIKGETIREKLDRETQFAIEEAVRIAREVADALDYAHRHGVIHRDIKPENLLLYDGRAMVMDFGIALAVSAAAGGRMTETGLSLGTPHYMSPEQATAEKEITPRSDIYSLASVLYEMLAGQPPHLGGAAQQVIMRIITDEARPVHELRRNVPPNVDAAIAKALEKVPADRFATAAEFSAALADGGFSTATTGARAHHTITTEWRRRAAVPALALAAVAIAANVWTLSRPEPRRQVSRYEVKLTKGNDLGEWAAFAISPDGSRLVYSRLTDRGWRLFVRDADKIEARELNGTESAVNPFFSPDGDRLGFMLGSSAVKIMGFDGAPPITVADSAVGSPGATWSRDGYIYFDALGAGPLLRVPARGSRSPERASTLDSSTGEQQHDWPEALPNGKGILFIVNYTGPGRQGVESDQVAILDSRTGKHRVLFAGIQVRYAQSGHLLYVTHDGTLLAVAFDEDRLEVIGEPVALAYGLRVSRTGGGAVNLSLSRTGTLWYSAGGGASQRNDVVWVSREGRVTPVDSLWVDNIAELALSPDATQIAVTLRRTDGQQVWLRDLRSGGLLEKLTFDGLSFIPWWRPTGRIVNFTSIRGAESGIWSVPADLSASPTRLLPSVQQVRDAAWSNDGTWLVFTDRASDIYGIRPGVDSAPRALVKSGAVELTPRVSPDGRWIAYSSNRTGAREIFVSPFPETDRSLAQISREGGASPRWSANGRELLYRSGTGEIVAAELRTVPSIAVVARRTLFRLDGMLEWDLAKDGRIIAIRDRGTVGAVEHIVVENFFDELRAKVPR